MIITTKTLYRTKQRQCQTLKLRHFLRRRFLRRLIALHKIKLVLPATSPSQLRYNPAEQLSIVHKSRAIIERIKRYEVSLFI